MSPLMQIIMLVVGLILVMALFFYLVPTQNTVTKKINSLEEFWKEVHQAVKENSEFNRTVVVLVSSGDQIPYLAGSLSCLARTCDYGVGYTLTLAVVNSLELQGKKHNTVVIEVAKMQENQFLIVWDDKAMPDVQHTALPTNHRCGYQVSASGIELQFDVHFAKVQIT